MAKTSKKTQRVVFWHSGCFAAALVIAAVALLHLATDVVGVMERRFYDFALSSNPPKPSSRIAIIAIDDQSIANIGRWAWPRDVHAKLIDQLAAAGAKTIVHTAFFFEPQTDRGMDYILRMREAVAASADAGVAGLPLRTQLAALMTEAEAALNNDAKLAASMAKAGNVLVPSVFELLPPQGRPDKDLPPYAVKSAIDELDGFSIPARSSLQPIAAIGNAAAGIGHMNQLPDLDGAIRSEPLLINYFNTGVPSIALLAAAHSLNLKPSDIRVNNGASVQAGGLLVATNRRAVMRPVFYKTSATQPAFPVDSFYDVLSGKITASKYSGKIVFIGATAAGLGTQFAVPGFPAMVPVEMLAHITSSILQGHFVVQPVWAVATTVALFLLVAAYLLAVLPRLSAGAGASVTGLLLLLLLGGEFGFLAGGHVWIHSVLPAVLLMAGHLALTTKRFLLTEAGKVRSDEESAETNRMMGLALQGQGQLDMAFDRFRRVPVGEAVMDNLNNLGLDFERKRQFNKAQAVYEHMARMDRSYKDLRAKYKRVKRLAEAVLIGGSSSQANRALLVDNAAVEKPMLGRYQVEKELGKGAMGVVYLGKDPKIGRVVAIKTLALGDEFEGAELVDARQRFFREAETAGRLQHQNIVTIFDAGEEHDLAYIAMEFLKGSDLVAACKTGQLLPVAQVLSIIARVAEALHYAHQQNVVHRDIKPANIMFDSATDTVKVTDFGIARITDSSKTRTGLVLGTPSFMSPEQLAGKRVDGRSDLYSLGVMLYQMLAARLPFGGDSMAALMFKIANEEAPDIRNARKELSTDIALLVAYALQKRPEMRYQTGFEMAVAVRKTMASLAEQQPVTTRQAVKSSTAGGQNPPAVNYDSNRKPARRNVPDFSDTVPQPSALPPPLPSRDGNAHLI